MLRSLTHDEMIIYLIFTTQEVNLFMKTILIKQSVITICFSSLRLFFSLECHNSQVLLKSQNKELSDQRKEKYANEHVFKLNHHITDYLNDYKYYKKLSNR